MTTDAYDSGAKSDQRDNITIASLIMTILNFLGLLLFVPVVIGANWYVAGIYEELNAQLPWITEHTLYAPWWVWFLKFFIPASILVALQIFARKSKFLFFFNIFIFVVFVPVSMVLWIGAIFWPLFEALLQ